MVLFFPSLHLSVNFKKRLKRKHVFEEEETAER